MPNPSSRRGIWVPRSCFWPLMLLLGAVIRLDKCIFR
jgi:hypothetical protein